MFFKQNSIASFWKNRARELYEQGKSMPPSWNCKVRVDILIDEMKKAGLTLGKEFVVVRCKVKDYYSGQLLDHICLEMFGSNAKERPDSQGNIHSVIDGFIIDPASPGATYRNVWKGEYTA